jgi:hypothetical protein
MPERNIHLESGKAGNLLVWPLDNHNQLIPYQLEMLVRYRPPYILPCFLRFRDGRPQLCQEITDHSPLDQSFYSQELHPDRGRAILLELSADLDDAGDQLLPADCFSLQPDMIFLNSERKLRLAFWPSLPDRQQHPGLCEQLSDFRELLRLVGRAFSIPAGELNAWMDQLEAGGFRQLHQFISEQTKTRPESLEHSQTKPIRHAISLTCRAGSLPGRILRTLDSPGVLVPLHAACLAGLLLESRSGASWPVAVKVICLLLVLFLLWTDVRHICRKFDVSQPAVPEEKKQHEDIPCSKISNLAAHLVKAAAGFRQLLHRTLNKPSVDLLDPGAQTVFHFTDPADFRMALLFEGKPGTLEENEGIRAYILVDEFVIGRDQKNSDLYLENPEVGRQHARILRRSGSFFLCDLGSRNGTSIDGRRLLKNTENLLPDRCLVKFADRPFHFQAD